MTKRQTKEAKQIVRAAIKAGLLPKPSRSNPEATAALLRARHAEYVRQWRAKWARNHRRAAVQIQPMIHTKLGFDPQKLMAGVISAGNLGCSLPKPAEDSRTRERIYNTTYKRRWRENRRRLGLPV